MNASAIDLCRHPGAGNGGLREPPVGFGMARKEHDSSPCGCARFASCLKLPVIGVSPSRCVRKMDHHCHWVGHCVGHDNYKASALRVPTCVPTSLAPVQLPSSSSRDGNCLGACRRLCLAALRLCSCPLAESSGTFRHSLDTIAEREQRRFRSLRRICWSCCTGACPPEVC